MSQKKKDSPKQPSPHDKVAQLMSSNLTPEAAREAFTQAAKESMGKSGLFSAISKAVLKKLTPESIGETLALAQAAVQERKQKQDQELIDKIRGELGSAQTTPTSAGDATGLATETLSLIAGIEHFFASQTDAERLERIQVHSAIGRSRLPETLRNAVGTFLSQPSTGRDITVLLEAAGTPPSQCEAVAKAIEKARETLKQNRKDSQPGRFRALMQEVQRAHTEKEKTRQAEQGPGFERGTGEPEPQIPLFAPSDDDGWDVKLMQYDLPAAKAKRAKAMLDALPIGGSRFGGVPDLPPGFDWPVFRGKKLPFLAQIDLSELPSGAFPPEGWLFVFALLDVPEEPVVLLHHDGPRSGLKRSPEPDRGHFWPANLNACSNDLLPLTPAVQKGGKPKIKKSWQEAGALFGEIEYDGPAGDIADRQNRSGNDWINLLTLNSVGSMMWSDCGYLHFVIRRQDLERRDFSNVCAAIRGAG